MRLKEIKRDGASKKRKKRQKGDEEKGGEDTERK